jgi:hypothetical protein
METNRLRGRLDKVPVGPYTSIDRNISDPIFIECEYGSKLFSKSGARILMTKNHHFFISKIVFL